MASIPEGMNARSTEVQPEEVDRPELAPTSFSQERLWFLEQLDPGSATYNLPSVVRLSGDLDVEALRRAVHEVVQRHGTLRTTFALRDGRPVQVIAPTLELPLPVVDLRDHPDRERAARERATVEARRPFDLTRGPLLRVALFRLEAREHLLLVNTHQTVSDEGSIGILVRELAALYQAAMEGRPSPRPPPSIQYADYAAGQREWLRSEAMEEQLAYWRARLDPDVVLDLPSDRPRPPVRSAHGARQTVLLPTPLARALDTLGQREGTTLFVTLLAAFEALLFRYTGQTDLVVGTHVAGRTRAGWEGLIGRFANTLPLRTDLSGAPTFRELVGRVHGTVRESLRHQDVPFEALVDALHPERSLNLPPLFQVAFDLQDAPAPPLELPGLVMEAQPVDTGTVTVTVDLRLVAAVQPEGLRLTAEYSTALFDVGTVARLLSHLEVLLSACVADPDARVSDLPLMAEEERRRVLVEWNATDRATPGTCAHRLFEAQVDRTPDAVAITFEGAQLTYRELDTRANQLAHHLRALGVGPDVPVALCLHASLDLVVAILGVLKADGAYVPLDPTYPLERLTTMLRQVASPVLITRQELADELPSTGEALLCLDTEADHLGALPTARLPSRTTPDNLAYVIFTSGSTGTPKGTLLTHRGLCNTVLAACDALRLRPDSRMLQFAPSSFDASVWEIFAALFAGARVCLAPRAVLMPGPTLHRVLAEQAITTINLTPSVLTWTSDEGLPALRTVLSGGEPCPPEIVRRWGAGRHFINAYGPTEVTICATLDDSPDPDRPSIGRPLPNVRLYVLDPHLQPVPIGVPGELFIGGPGVARGYLHQPALTAERFVPDPFSVVPGARLYRTGDRVRYLPDGKVEFLGRIDSQVKVRGFRIELGEVEAALLAHPGVQQAVVVVREDAEDRYLAAYLVPAAPEPPLTSAELRASLLQRLPEYMVPAAFVPLPSLPLFSNGKVNLRALPAPEALQLDSGRIYEPPRNATERLVANLWGEVLRSERVGLDDSFFELGGNSLLALQAHTRLKAALGIELALTELFQHPTVRALAERIEQLDGRTDARPG